MITTLTPNPSLDRTVALPGPLQRGGVNRLVSVTVEPGGKGLNVARVLAACGAEVTAVLPSPPGDPLLAAIESAALPGAGSVTTRAVSVAETAAVEDALLAAVRASTTDTARPWAVLSGSLPPGAPTDWYARLVRLLRRAAPGVRIAVDTSDAPLAALATALPGAALDLIKPNGEELGQLAGLPAERAMALEQGALAGDLAPVVDAARVLVGAGISAVMATLGPAGAVLVTDEAAWHATAPDIAVRSTVGAGDSAVAGYVLADTRGEDAPGRLATAMAYGSAAAALPGTRLPTPQDLPTTAAVVTRLE
ncbi:1-phosphofructokinase family hexose kinase [Actinomyces sp. 217892]|uniref:1-phosphofructokinase family hexose kinase n=1 Tax=Actinomyces sp. 217892 TaxID=2927827 RepID=UPI002030109B|nr:PfkB family carbohydrate kinase [Actinomyces sp. 217892]